MTIKSWPRFVFGILLLAAGMYVMYRNDEPFDYRFWSGMAGWLLAGLYWRANHDNKKKLERAERKLATIEANVQQALEEVIAEWKGTKPRRSTIIDYTVTAPKND